MESYEATRNRQAGARKKAIETEPDRKRILLVDDHPIVRQGLAQMLQCEPDVIVCGEAESVDQAMELLESTQPHLVVLDLALRESSGLDLIGRINQKHSQVHVLVLSMHQDAFHAERAIRAGVKGFVGKEELPQNVLEAIRTILRGGFYFGGHLAERLVGSLVMDRKGKGELPSIGRLSQRELQVFEMIGAGHSTRVIAKKLDLSIKTVETYRAKIKQKLDLQDATQLLQRALQWVQYSRQDLGSASPSATGLA